jgi:hypothetical protein
MTKLFVFSFFLLLLLGCATIKSQNTCTNSLLRIIQFDDLIEFGIKDSSVYRVVDLSKFFNLKDSIKAKEMWDDLIDGTRFFDGGKFTLKNTYEDAVCECQIKKDTIFIKLNRFYEDGRLDRVEMYKLLKQQQQPILVEKKVKYIRAASNDFDTIP